MNRLLAWILISLGSLAALGGLGHLAILLTGNEADHIEATAAQLEAGAHGDAEWLRVSDGHLYWPATVIYLNENLATKEQTGKGVYVPLVSRELAEDLDRQAEAGEEQDYAKVRVIVHLTQEQIERDFPMMTAGVYEETTTPYSIEGRNKQAKTLPLKVKQYISSNLGTIQVHNASFIENGAKPAEWGGVFGGALLALIFLGAGLRRRERYLAQRAPANPFAHVTYQGGVAS